MWELVYYETARGHCPVQEYLDGLDDREAAKVLFDFDLLEDLGTALGAPHVKKISGKIWELRTTGRLQHRTFYFAASGRQIVLLHAFTKKTQKTPRAEIEIAGRRMDDYLQRLGSDET